jgi:hypothetical protein
MQVLASEYRGNCDFKTVVHISKNSAFRQLEMKTIACGVSADKV